ncbi:hypothetical protein SCP_0213400 [Sparassis crispa]|uniref:Uncharacterized protein n=1 Tax=Sparassis crispa TaxID=139825 RepID=A0A401GD98_9APHY|nr:hypothetical protein SCP_0213400 [Sparassis crispa]GBE80137.1 hypothetical protein SCP_0213400 [Sparassis crispa]
MPTLRQRLPTRYRFIINVEKAAQVTLVHNPRLYAKAERDGMHNWVDILVDYTVAKVSREVPIPELFAGNAWIGSGHSSLCWILPMRMLPQYCTPEDEWQLRKFQKMVGLGGNPVIMVSCNGVEPARYKTMETPEFLIEWSLLSFTEHCMSGELTVEKLLASYHGLEMPDVQSLSLEDASKPLVTAKMEKTDDEKS